MREDSLTIPQNSLLEMLKYQPESVLIELFDNLIVSSDLSPLTDEEKSEIEHAKEEFYKGETIAWKK
jgi:hypothetical protein